MSPGVDIRLCFLFLVAEGVLYAQDTSPAVDAGEVVDDWSAPQLTIVFIISSNANTGYAQVGDTVWVNFSAVPESNNYNVFTNWAV